MISGLYPGQGPKSLQVKRTLQNKVTLPMSHADVITDGEWHMSDDGFDMDLVVAEQKEKLQDS